MVENKKLILIAEDDRYISIAYKDGLIRAGFDVIIAMNGEEAISKIKSEHPDLVMLDIIMPIKNGFEVLEEIKSDPKTKKIPVIILSNLGQETDIDKAKKLGAEDYLIKADFSMKDVIKRVNSELNTEI